MRIKKFSAFVFILLIVSASAVWADDVKVDEDTFPDKIFRRYVSEKIDVGGTGESGVEAGDGKLSRGEISRVLTMDLSAYNYFTGGGIENLTGIKIFTDLQTLQCSYHKLKALNVSGMTHLSKLYCYANELETLNVEGCTVLTVLECNNNKLSGTLDLSELKELETLSCQYNEDLSVVLPKRAEGRIGLKYVNCNYIKSAGPLTSEVFTPQLESLQLEGMTGITTLDLSKANYLSRLNVSGDSNLTTINWDMTTQGMTFYGLHELNISGTQVDVQKTLDILTGRSFDPSEFRAAYMVGGRRAIDISKMTRLQYLDLRGNGLTSITMPEKTTQSYSYFYLESNDLTAMPSIPDGAKYVYVSYNKLTSLGGAVSKSAGNIPNVGGTSYTIPVTVTELYADNNQLTSANLSHLTGLQELNLSNNLLTNSGLVLPEELSELSIWYSGAEIHLANNRFTSMPRFPERVVHLDISGNSITNVTTGNISTDILQFADFSRNGLTSFNASMFPHLFELSLSSNDITELDVSAIKELTFLNVDDNPNLASITGLSAPEYLKSLNVSGTKIPLSLLPRTVGFLHINRMSYDMGDVDLSEFKSAYAIYASDNPSMTSVKLPEGEWHQYSSSGGWWDESREFHFSNNGLTSFDAPIGTAWVYLDNNHLPAINLDNCIDPSGDSWLETAEVGGQTVETTQTVKKNSKGNWEWSVRDLQLQSRDLTKLEDVQGYASDGTAITTKYDSSTGIATFSAMPDTVKYTYNTGIPFRFGESQELLSMDVTVTNFSRDIGDEIAPVLGTVPATLTLTAGTAMTPLTITAIEGTNLSWSSTGLPDGLTGSAASNDMSYTISGTPSASTAGRTFKPVIIASNSLGTASASIEVIVAAPGTEVAPVLGTVPATLTLTAGTAMTPLTIKASQGTNLRWSSTGLPDGLTGTAASDAKSYTISGTPSATMAGRRFNAVISASNSLGTDEANISIVVSSSGGGNEKTADDINNMTPEQKQEVTDLTLKGSVNNLSALIAELPNLENLDLSETSVEDVNISNNSSIKVISIANNTSVKNVNISGSGVQTINGEGCDNLEEANIEGCDSLTYLDFGASNLKSLNVRDCENLTEIHCDLSQLLTLDLNPLDLPSLQTLDCGGQTRGGISMSQSMNFTSMVNNANASLSAASVNSASEQTERVSNLKAYDSNGNEITSSYDSSTGTMSFASIPASFSYDYDTGINGTLMDVTVSSSNINPKPSVRSRSSSGGCDSFMGAGALLCLAMFSFMKKR